MSVSKVALPTHLRRWGLKVETADGWKTRGRPYDFSPKAVICHHTASNSASGNFASNNIVTDGRSDLPGPLCQFLLGRDGRVRIIAAGYANHAGYGGPRAGIPQNLGNTFTYGIEAENNGIGEKWSKAQLNAYYRLCAALLNHMGIKDVDKVFAHKEWTSRKIDPAGIVMDEFRNRVKAALAHGPSVVTVRLSKLKPGNRNLDVLQVKRRLNRRGYFDGELNNYYGKGFTRAYKLYQRELGYEGQDANGLPGKISLQKLGFRVLP